MRTRHPGRTPDEDRDSARPGVPLPTQDARLVGETSAASLSPVALHNLQRDAGNHAVARMVGEERHRHGAAMPVQRMAAGHTVQRWRNGQVEDVSANESARYNRRGRQGNWTQVDKQTNRRIKHYLIAWKDENTAVVGVKAQFSPYDGTPAYGGGFPAPAGGTSEMSEGDMDRAWQQNRGQTPPGNLMRNHTLHHEVDQELLRSYQLTDVGHELATGSAGRNDYKVWNGTVAAVDNPPALPQGDRSYQENERTAEIRVDDLRHRRITGQSSTEEVLRAVADLAGTPLPAEVEQGSQAEVYLALDNFPVQELAKQLRAKIAWIEAEVEQATARSRALAGGGR
ncbi:hypothetical protein ACFV1R_28580 [Streptomyces coelicoflavus]|uniref:hypothetical protein n=1 Tax=Streptomyces coelicoflavus TaxID=285562 RepID=UPI0036AB864E